MQNIWYTKGHELQDNTCQVTPLDFWHCHLLQLIKLFLCIKSVTDSTCFSACPTSPLPCLSLGEWLNLQYVEASLRMKSWKQNNKKGSYYQWLWICFLPIRSIATIPKNKVISQTEWPYHSPITPKRNQLVISLFHLIISLDHTWGHETKGTDHTLKKLRIVYTYSQDFKINYSCSSHTLLTV